MELNPQVVKVTWKIDVKRRTLSLQRDIIFEGENPNVSAQPSRANLMVSVPQAMVKDAGYLAQFQVSVPSDTAMPAEDGAVNAPLQVAVPQGGRVLKISRKPCRFPGIRANKRSVPLFYNKEILE